MVKRTRKDPKHTPAPGSIGERVMALVDLDSRSPTEISVAAKLGGSYIRDLIRLPQRSPVMDKMDRLAAELGATGEWLAYGRGEPPVALSQHLNEIATKPALGADEAQTAYGEAAKLPLKDSLRAMQRPIPLMAPITPTPTPGAFSGEVAPVPWLGLNVAALKKDLPVRGTAVGSDVNGFILIETITEKARRPPALEGVEEAYALRVVGRSMAPLHKPRELCAVHPYLPYGLDDSVVIMTQAHEGAGVVAYLKTFVSEDETGVTTTQINPPATIHFARAQIVSVHKVITMNDVLGG